MPEGDDWVIVDEEVIANDDSSWTDAMWDYAIDIAKQTGAGWFLGPLGQLYYLPDTAQSGGRAAGETLKPIADEVEGAVKAAADAVGSIQTIVMLGVGAYALHKLVK